jgi:hypothetical protein
LKHPVKLRIILLLGLFAWFGSLPVASAAVDWEVVKEMNLEEQPLDIAASADGAFIFVLVPGSVLVYDNTEDKPTNRIPIDKTFDRITWSDKNKTIILTSTTSKAIKVIKVEKVHAVDVSGRPFKGASDAPVTIVVFSDYQ